MKKSLIHFPSDIIAKMYKYIYIVKRLKETIIC